MYFTSGSDRAFRQLMQTRPGADHFDGGEAKAPEDRGICRFYRPHWKHQSCIHAECPYQLGKLIVFDTVKPQVEGVCDKMAVFRVGRSRGYTVISNHHLRNRDSSLRAKGLLSQMFSLPEGQDYTLKGLSLVDRESIDTIRTAVWELERAGYITRRQNWDGKGKVADMLHTIYGQPQIEVSVLKQPILKNPVLENPTSSNPTPENPTQINRDGSSKEKSNIGGRIINSIPILSPPPPLEKAAATSPERKGTGAKLQSVVAAYREIIKDNIEYEHLCQHTKGTDRRLLDEIVDLLVETIYSARTTTHITRDDYSAELVRSELMRLNSLRMEFAFDCINENTTEVRNIKECLSAVLFDAPNTINGYYTAPVAHDMNTGKI